MLTAIRSLIRTLTLPNNAGQNDPAIIIGPDLPPCMQARYVAAWFFRPAGTISNTIDRPMKYVGLVNNPVAVQVDEGFALWDQKTPATICGFYAYKSSIATLNPAGSGNSVPQEAYADIAQGGAATMTGGGSTWFGSQFGFTPGRPWSVNIGGGFTPSLSPFTIDGFDAARGWRAQGSSNAASAAIAAEAVVLTTGAMTFYNGRAYEVLWAGNESPSVANNFAFNRVRQTNLAGTLLAFSEVSLPGAGGQIYVFGRAIIRRTAGTDLTDNLVLTTQAAAGTVTWSGAATDVRYLEVRDVGSSSMYPNAISI